VYKWDANGIKIEPNPATASKRVPEQTRDIGNPARRRRRRLLYALWLYREFPTLGNGAYRKGKEDF